MAKQVEDNLERLDKVVTEIEAHTQRLVRAAKLQSTPAGIMQELSETVMPLLKDFAVRTFAEVLSVRQYIHEHVEPALAGVGGVDDSILFADDAEMITQRLLSYRSMLEGIIERAVGEDRAKMAAELVEVDKTLARIAEITEDDEEPEEPAADEEEEEAEEEEEEGGDPAEAN